MVGGATSLLSIRCFAAEELIDRFMQTTDMSAERETMVHHQIEARGVRDRLVLQAMRTVFREEFVPENPWEFAFDDVPLPIVEEQTISQPYIVAFMIEAMSLKVYRVRSWRKHWAYSPV